MSFSTNDFQTTFSILPQADKELLLADLVGSFAQQHLNVVPPQGGTPLDRLSTLCTDLYFNGYQRHPSPIPSVTFLPSEHVPASTPEPPNDTSNGEPLPPIQEEIGNSHSHPDVEGNVAMRDASPTPVPSQPVNSSSHVTTEAPIMTPNPLSATSAVEPGTTAAAGVIRQPGSGDSHRVQPYPSPSTQQPVAEPTSISFDGIPLGVRMQGVKDARQQYKKQRVRRDRRPTTEFMANKKAQIGDDLYHKVLDGTMTLEQAMGPGYSVQQDPDRVKLISVPRTVGQRGFTKALRLHYQHLIHVSRAEFAGGVPASVAAKYNQHTNCPTPTRFGIDWSQTLKSKWNREAQWVFAEDFVLHIDQYRQLFDLPDYAANVNSVYNQFTDLLGSIRDSAQARSREEGCDDAITRASDKNLQNRLRRKLGCRLRVCHDVKALRPYYEFLNKVGPEGMSDEETDAEDQKVLPKALCGTIVREPRYRSAKCRALVRLLDRIKEVQDTSTLINPVRSSTASICPRKRDSGQYSLRPTPVGLPKLLYSDAFIKEVEEGTGFDLQYTNTYEDLTFPPALPEELLKNLKISADELTRMFQC
ncbi:hypothetical protein CPB86DRAFT_358179 [Serendipita vermifera]|nr:hypothetical protein CPB86DRAFT_358179 [Serendipita vermifera]